MPDTEVRTLSQSSEYLETCPVFLIEDDGSNLRKCDQPIRVVHTTWVQGDDYGSWREHDVFLECGHTIAEMQGSLRMEAHL